MKRKFNRGIIKNEFGDICGRYYISIYKPSRICFVLNSYRYYNYTQEGFASLLNHMKLFAQEN